jgi:hypothetical protein
LFVKNYRKAISQNITVKKRNKKIKKIEINKKQKQKNIWELYYKTGSKKTI